MTCYYIVVYEVILIMGKAKEISKFGGAARETRRIKLAGGILNIFVDVRVLGSSSYSQLRRKVDSGKHE